MSYTPEQVWALAEAMGQLLDDMGKTGNSVSPYAKAKARVAFEPFCPSEDKELFLSLEDAQQILRACE
jgi:hypothetical protein